MAYRHRWRYLFYAGRPYPDTGNGRAFNRGLVPAVFFAISFLTTWIMKIGLSYIPEVHQVNDVIEARISFRPLIAFLENSLDTERGAKAKLFRLVLEEFYKFPELNGAVGVEDIHHYVEPLELVYTLLAPLMKDEEEHLWAMSAPVSRHVFFGTDAYVKLAKSQNSAGQRSEHISEE